MKKATKDTIQWHPAFQASIQIEFEAEAEKLTFEPEHLLSKKPMQMDELIIKVAENEAIHKNIGRIFRRYNIIEYKSPDDNLTINDFYKVYGYCCFYQSDTDKICEIPPEELTITFICNHFPKKMVQHLKEFRGLNIIHVKAGIYYITGDAFPIQLLVTRELDPKMKISGCRVCAITCLSLRKSKHFSRNRDKKIIEIISSCNGSYYPGELGCSKGG